MQSVRPKRRPAYLQDYDVAMAGFKEMLPAVDAIQHIPHHPPDQLLAGADASPIAVTELSSVSRPSHQRWNTTIDEWHLSHEQSIRQADSVSGSSSPFLGVNPATSTPKVVNSDSHPKEVEKIVPLDPKAVSPVLHHLSSEAPQLSSRPTAHTLGHTTWPVHNPSGVERYYRGPQPTIPYFRNKDPSELAHLKMALDNLLPPDSTELFKYQVLVDHLKVEEACLIADSYLNSSTPYTDTILALHERFGQPHQIVLQRIAHIMDLPDIQDGHPSAFEKFSLQLPPNRRADFHRHLLQKPCSLCKRRHLQILHEVNDRPQRDQPKAKSYLVNTPTQLLYLNKPVSNTRVLLKVVRVLLHCGECTLDTFAILDDGSERTILLPEATRRLGLKGTPESLTLRTIRHDIQMLHGSSVSFQISSFSQPQRRYQVSQVFTASQLVLVDHSYPVSKLQAQYHHLSGLPLQLFERAKPLLLVGADHPHLITPIEPVKLGPPGGRIVMQCLCYSLPSAEEARQLIDKLRALLARGGFELRQWSSNVQSVTSHLPVEARSGSSEQWLAHEKTEAGEGALGLSWNCPSDMLTYKSRVTSHGPATMRVIYKVLASQYNPLGYILPFVTRAKVLVQRLWGKHHGWDDPLLPGKKSYHFYLRFTCHELMCH
ncbi:hypothetical protein MHYP_G00343880 [Metynnis hypsauchen]